MFAAGELHEVFGVAAPEVKPPSIKVTEAARKAILAASDGESGALRIEISAQFEYALSIDEPAEKDLVVDAGGLKVAFDRQSAAKADGMVIDFLDANGGGFKITNPNEPPRVQEIGVTELKKALEAGKLELFDVRTPDERATAKIEGAQHFDQAAQEKLQSLSKDTPLYFHCHHGGRSRQAAEHYLRQGFTKVFNVAGGIDAWSVEVDPGVKRY